MNREGISRGGGGGVDDVLTVKVSPGVRVGSCIDREDISRGRGSDEVLTVRYLQVEGVG